MGMIAVNAAVVMPIFTRPFWRRGGYRPRAHQQQQQHHPAEPPANDQSRIRKLQANWMFGISTTGESSQRNQGTQLEPVNTRQGSDTPGTRGAITEEVHGGDSPTLVPTQNLQLNLDLEAGERSSMGNQSQGGSTVSFVAQNRDVITPASQEQPDPWETIT